MLQNRFCYLYLLKPMMYEIGLAKQYNYYQYGARVINFEIDWIRFSVLLFDGIFPLNKSSVCMHL